MRALSTSLKLLSIRRRHPPHRQAPSSMAFSVELRFDCLNNNNNLHSPIYSTPRSYFFFFFNGRFSFQGHIDVDLNEVGRKQAAAVAERLSGESRISAVYSSDLKRALETAEIIARNVEASRYESKQKSMALLHDAL